VGFLLLFLAAFVPFEGPGHVNASVLVIALMLVLWLLDMLVAKRNFQFVNSRVLLSVVIFMAISTIAFGMGQVPWFIFANQAPLDAQAGGFAIFMLSAAALVLAAHLIRDVRWLRIIVWTYIAIGTVYALGRAVELPFIDEIYLIPFTASSMFWTWLVALTLGQAIFNSHLKTQSRVLLFTIVLITFYVASIQANDWKSGWVPPLVCAAVLLGLRYKRLVVFAIPFVLIAAAVFAIKLVASDEYSWGTRLDAWVIVLEISKVNPLLGLGFANYYWYTPLFPIRGWFVRFNSHSQYVDLIAQVGILGLLCFLWIFIEVGRLGWRLTKQLPDGFERSYAYGVLAGVAGTLAAAFLVDWVLPFVYNIGFSGFRASILPWIFFGGLVSVEQIYFGSNKSEIKEV
jgi:O-antigen ligase